MPRDLPGFYFDAEKNRYFPIKGPIPGSSRNCSPASTSNTVQKSTSKPNLVWKLQGTERIGDSALELIHVNIDRPQGLTGTNILFAASKNGSFSFFVGGKVRRQFDYGVRCMPDCVWPLNIEEREMFVEAPVHLWRPSGASVNMTSHISCMKVSGKHSSTDGLLRQHLLITSLGSETSGGSVYTLNLSEPLDYDFSSLMLRRRVHKAASFDCTVWTADCNFDGSQAVVGTNLGASMVNLETGVPSWVFRCKSDVLSLQFDHSGQTVLCGLRNGAIVTVDTREKSEGLSARLARHRIPYPSQGSCKPSSTTPQNFTKRWIELRGNIFESLITSMPSSISCLASLQLYDQYFLASSMDGSIRLYDHRLMQKGPIQLYEGNVNSHTRIQLGVDPYERFLMSGGEDCNLRLWSIKSGELLFEDKFMNSIPSVVCWPRELPRVQDDGKNNRDCVYRQEHSSGAWLGSEEGLFHMRWS